MNRYLRLYLYFIRFSFSKAMEFRVDFFFRVVMDCVFYAVNLAFFSVLYGHISELGGLSEDQIYIFVCGYLFMDAVAMTLYSNNMWWLPFLINRGDLDYYLVRPVSTLFFVSLREFAANSCLNLIVATGLLTWSLARYPTPLGAGPIALFILLLFVGVLLYWIMQLSSVIPIFWIHQGQALRQLFFHLNKLGERPHRIYRGWTLRLLTSLLPFALLTSIPTYFLFEGVDVGMFTQYALVILVAFAIVVGFWRWGLRNYVSASS